MKRDARLHALSADHHHALVVARDLERAAEAGPSPGIPAELRSRFDRDLAPHFALEERLLLPALRAAGLNELTERTLREHRLLREHLEAAEGGDLGHLRAFAALLTEHVRFEERELFPACEESVPGAVLDEVAAARGRSS